MDYIKSPELNLPHNIEVLEISGTSGKSEINTQQQIKCAVGELFLFASKKEISSDQILLMTDIDGVLRDPMEEILTPGKLSSEIL